MRYHPPPRAPGPDSTAVAPGGGADAFDGASSPPSIPPPPPVAAIPLLAHPSPCTPQLPRHRHCHRLRPGPGASPADGRPIRRPTPAAARSVRDGDGRRRQPASLCPISPLVSIQRQPQDPAAATDARRAAARGAPASGHRPPPPQSSTLRLVSIPYPSPLLGPVLGPRCSGTAPCALFGPRRSPAGKALTDQQARTRTVPVAAPAHRPLAGPAGQHPARTLAPRTG